MFCEPSSQLPENILPIVLQILKFNIFPILSLSSSCFSFSEFWIILHPEPFKGFCEGTKRHQNALLLERIKIPCFLHHDEGPKDICRVALFCAFECSITATIQLATCFPFLVSSNAPHCTNPWSVAAEWVSEMLLFVTVAYSSHSIPMVIPDLCWE